jgi:hypothetical protein
VHCGPVRDDGGSRVRYVIDKGGGAGTGTVELGWMEARAVVHALLLDMLGGELKPGEESLDCEHAEVAAVEWDAAGAGQNRGAP